MFYLIADIRFPFRQTGEPWRAVPCFPTQIRRRAGAEVRVYPQIRQISSPAGRSPRRTSLPRRDVRRGIKRQTACKPGSVPARPERWTAIHLGRRLPDASRDLPGRRRGDPPGVSRAAPIRSCSRWGLPCRPRRRGRGALLPHPFTLTPDRVRGGLLSVALSLGSPPPGITRHRVSVEPGLSSPRRVAPLPRRDRPAVWRCLLDGDTQAEVNFSSARSRARVPLSGSSATRPGRKWRWKATSAARVASSRTPLSGTP